MIKKKTKKVRSIRYIMLISILALTTLMGICLIVAISFSGVYTSLNQVASKNLSKIVSTRSSELSKKMNTLADIALNMSNEIEKQVNQKYSDGSISELMKQDTTVTKYVLNAGLKNIINTLKLNSASGVFICLNNSAHTNYLNSNKHASIYIRDEDLKTYSEDYNSLLTLRGSRELSFYYHIPFDNYWTEEWLINNDNNVNYDFYNKPYNSAMKNYNLEKEKLGYWSYPFDILNDSIKVITYTIPLLDSQGTPYGIIGIELSESYIINFLNYSELNYSQNCFYLLTESTSFNNDVHSCISNGPFSNYYIQDSAPTLTRRLTDGYGDNIYEYIGGHNSKVPAIASKYSLNLYYPDSPFYSMKWELSGYVKKSDLFEASNNLKITVIGAFVFIIVFGTLVGLFLVDLITNPIRKLSKAVNSIDNEYQISLGRTNLSEIDSLADSIENLSKSLVHSANLIMDTVKLTNSNIGIFEINAKNNRVFMTELLFEIFNIDFKAKEYYIDLNLWNQKYEETFQIHENKLDNVFIVSDTKTGEKHWYDLKIVCVGGNVRGVIIDVTSDVLEKKFLEYERDIDPLTKLLNRRAFLEQSTNLINTSPNLKAMVIFIDLDNLKAFNDTYGHDIGDLYIQGAADIFKRFTKYNALVSRISGDEFLILLPGKSEHSILNVVKQCLEDDGTNSIILPNNTLQKIRYSLGYSWYPKHARELDLLIKYADFAMFEVKQKNKGSIKEFNMASYLRDSYLLDKKEALNMIIENNLVKYVFQPIIEVETAKVFAYEALVRPEFEGLNSPYHLLQLAKMQAKLYHIEKLTYFNVFEWIKENHHRLNGKLIFFNSIPNQILSDTDIKELDDRYLEYYPYTVTEITENEICSDDYIASKTQTVRSRKGRLAVDDFGSGYSNDLIVLKANPDFVKVDMSLIRNIHIEPRKQHLVSNIINYCKSLNIKILAEGIETYDELKVLIELGVDYLQGYYTGRPQPDITELSDIIKKEIQEIKKINGI